MIKYSSNNFHPCFAFLSRKTHLHPMFKTGTVALFFSILLTGTAFGQSKAKRAGRLSAAAIEQLQRVEDTLAVLAYAVVNDSIEQERFGACRALITGLVRALKVENSFNYRFDKLKSISILAPQDSSFRIFTWQLFVNDSTYRYYGAIQMNQSALQLHALRDRSFEMESKPVGEALSADKWYGALYYQLRAFESKKGVKYLLCGFDAYSFFEKRKVIDILSFDEAGKPTFGAPVFVRDGGKISDEHRLLFEYSAEASVRVNWDEQYKMILFDHLIPLRSPFGRGTTLAPDGSYDGLRYEKGYWVYIAKVFNDFQEEAPRPEPVLESGKGKDIMGKTKGKKGKKG